ncbi:T9SS type A sorting domain-containing protein, partial [candidate division KSB1 bacterium]|nr:T9SS type A sorting domain-containing protein [candidate division KSB1 bacterium]
EISRLPESFRLKQNYPNPFNPETLIEYDLPASAQVVLTIYDVRGNEVQTLESTAKSAGTHTVMWDGRNEFGTLVSTGLYFYRLDVVSENAKFSQTRKMILMK